MESTQLERYKEELAKVNQRLTSDADNTQLISLKHKLERIVELLESKVPKRKPKLGHLSINKGQVIDVHLDNKWRQVSVLETKLPEFIVVNCAATGMTVQVDDPKNIRLRPPEGAKVTTTATKSSNPRAPNVKVEKAAKVVKPQKGNTINTNTTNNSKDDKPKTAQTKTDYIEERQQSWKAFSSKRLGRP